MLAMTITRPVQIMCAVGTLIFLLAVLSQSSSGDALMTKLARPKEAIHSKDFNLKPRYIFVDLGANSADSLAIFLKEKNTKFDFDFPKPSWATYAEADIYLFEANPHFNTAILKAKEKNNALGINVNIFPSTVVDVRDGTRTFFIDTVNEEQDFWGSSIYSTHPDAVKSKAKGTELSAINISRWLLMNTLPRDFVVVKMDIEGAEYQILPHMAEMHVESVIDYLLVEWHSPTQFAPTEEEAGELDSVARAALAKMEAGGIKVPVYQSPA